MPLAPPLVVRCRRWIAAHTGWLAAGLLALMFGLGLLSMRDDSAIFDEVAHIAAGYSYLRYAQFRLNPEHPPLMKDLAGAPLQLMNLRFPDQSSAWTTEANGQWQVGADFLYHIGNDANRILLCARLPILLLAVGFGAWLYWFCRRRYGQAGALLILFFYALSPNIIAHARYVTTDLGASVFIFLALVAFERFARSPQRFERIAILGVALAAAQVSKFSAIMLYPFLGMTALLLVLVPTDASTPWTRAKLYGGGLLAASALSLLVVWTFYYPHVLRMPITEQDKLIQGSVFTRKVVRAGDLLTTLNKFPLMEPLAQYLTGLAMVFRRVAGGGPTYFNGAAKMGSFRGYFPELFLLKTQCAFVLLIFVPVALAIHRALARSPIPRFRRLGAHVGRNSLEWVVGGFALFYFLVAVLGNLNLGIRHLLPMFVPLFVVVGASIMSVCHRLNGSVWRPRALVALSVLLAWYAGSTLYAHPYYTAYFNELIGGPARADRFFADSSVDWGQDLRRLKAYVDVHPEIRSIAIDYFGGGDLAYYFCAPSGDSADGAIGNAAGDGCHANVYVEGIREAPPGRYPGQYLRTGVRSPAHGYSVPERGAAGEGQYMAVSETLLTSDLVFSSPTERRYDYLRGITPAAKVGNSIYVYHLN
jgi:4-amino-4-deoxy-L-arabinose transferase-like glycosyltransferase